MTTITAEVFAMNLERYLKEALKRGLRVITPQGETLTIAKGEPLTENGMTEREEQELLKAIQEGEEDLKAGRYTTIRSTEELHSFLDSL